MALPNYTGKEGLHVQGKGGKKPKTAKEPSGGTPPSARKEPRIIQNGKVDTKKLLISRDKGLLQMKPFRLKNSRNRRKTLLQKFPFLFRLFKCISKRELVRILHSLSEQNKRLLQAYMQHYFVIHLHVRQIKYFAKLMNHRHLFFQAIADPELLRTNTSVGNNIIKNFCKGIVNFVCVFQSQLVQSKLLDIQGDPGFEPLDSEKEAPSLRRSI